MKKCTADEALLLQQKGSGVTNKNDPVTTELVYVTPEGGVSFRGKLGLSPKVVALDRRDPDEDEWEDGWHQ